MCRPEDEQFPACVQDANEKRAVSKFEEIEATRRAWKRRQKDLADEAREREGKP